MSNNYGEKLIPEFKMPEFKINQSKNGYEIRTEILKMAKDLVAEEYHSKFHGWELSVNRDEKGVVTTTVGMPPFPGLDQVLKTAESMYNFVNQSASNVKPR
jgi:hypothetical protein